MTKARDVADSYTDEEIDNIVNQVGGSLATIEESAATEGQQVFTTSTAFAGKDFVGVFVNGVRQAPSSYSTSGTNTVTLSETLVEGDNVVITVNEAVSSTVPATALVMNADQVVGLQAASIESLLAVDTTESTLVTVLNYHSDTEGGGGTFYWDATQDKANHNGGTIIAQGAPYPADWDNESLLLLWFGFGQFETGTGCWVREAVNIHPEHFGAKATRISDSNAIRKALEVLAGEPLYLNAKRYYYDGAIINTPKVRILGEGMPSVNSGKTALENGSIIDGSFPFTSSDADFRDFGVDNGSDSSSTDGDGLRTTAPLNAGGHLHTENIVALAKSSSAYHALLFQSHSKHTGGNLLGVYGLFGFVSKCTNVSLGTVHSIYNDESGVLLKSDTSFGTCGNVSIQEVVCDCLDTQKRGFHIQSSDKALRNVQIGQIHSENALDNVLIQLGASGVDIRNVYIKSVISKNSKNNDILIDTTTSTGVIFDVKVDSVFTEDTQGRSIVAKGNGGVRDLGIESVFASHISTATDSELDNSAFIGRACARTKIGSLTILRNFSASYLGGISYSNTSSGVNSLGMRNAKVYGAGALDTGYSEINISGTNQAITIPFNRGGDAETHIRVIPAASGNSINVFNHEYFGITGYAAQPFRRGYLLTIQNFSSNTLNIIHNVGGKVRTLGGVTKTIPGFDTVSFVWNGSMWVQF